MKRREFLRNAGIACTVALTSPLLGKLSFADELQTSTSFALEELSIRELQEGMKSGRFTAVSLVESYLKRIDEIDKHGPAINTVIELNPDAHDIAEALDRERKEKGPRGPMHGIPVLIKDNIATHDRMMTTAGSLALVGAVPPDDSFVAKKLRAAGAVILGKTNLSEWANIRSSHSVSGWSARGGQTKNPYGLNRNPCGSSSGSGGAPAANLCAAAIGTETDGSIVCPSTHHSLVGIKPTVGLVSRAGIIPISHSQDTAGPMTRTVADAAILLGALTGIDPNDSATKASEGRALRDYTQFLNPDGLRGARIGVVRGSFGSNDQVDELMNQRIEEMKKLGAVIVDPAEIPNSDETNKNELLVLLYELKADLNSYLSWLGPKAPVHSLKEVIDFNEKNRDTELKYFGQDLFIKAEAKGPLTTKEYLDALENNHQLTREKGIDFVLQDKKLDALIAPTGTPAWISDYITGDAYVGGYSSASAIAGYPHITVPAGFVYGLPIGLSFFASAYSEPKLIQFAYAFEQATKARRAPTFPPNVMLS